VLAVRRPLVKEIEQSEKKLAGRTGEKKLRDARLADPAFYGAGNGGGSGQLQELLKRQAVLQNWIEEAECRWMALSEQLEELGREAF
jgi:ATP-binding cassette subfamily F protein 3